MTLLIDIEQNLPPAVIQALSADLRVPVHRVGSLYRDKTGPGCGRSCIWNGGGYYADSFVCGETYPSGQTFYCSADCHLKVGESSKVFLSFSWSDAEIADKIAGCARGAAIEIIRDINEIDFLESISSFMNCAAESRYFVAVMTEAYFRSRYCMYEFVQLSESKLPIRTIPVMLERVLQPDFRDELLSHWRSKHVDLSASVRGIDKRYTAYLHSEFDLLNAIPRHLENFFTLWNAKERPRGEHWLIANCRFLTGAIKTTFSPGDEDASNWTYSNKTVSAYRAADSPPAGTWQPKPFYLHATTEAEAKSVTDIPEARELALQVYLDASSPEALPSGVHVALISDSAMESLDFCTRIQSLLDREDVTFVPLIDERFRAPTSEVPALKRWSYRRANAPSGTDRDAIDEMLVRFGPMMIRVRDALVPSADIVFTLDRNRRRHSDA